MLIWILFLLYLPQLSVALRPTRHETRRNTPDIQFWNRIAQVHIDRKLLLNPHLIGGETYYHKALLKRTNRNASIVKNFKEMILTNEIQTSSLSNHVTDSAAGAMALFTGWKVNTGTLGMKPIVKEKCTNVSELHITDGIVEGALQKGMGVGFVTTTRITHATPAALYAKGVDRNHEFDDATLKAEVKCTHDIAKQLLSYPASEFKVMMGGGSGYLMDKSRNGSRSDGLNVDLKWQKLSDNRRVLRNMLEFDEVSAAANEKLLGIFSPSHLPYYLDELLAGAKTVPLLWEMTSKAIEQLQNEQNGYFLMIEGGMIDIAEHENMMHVAFKEVYDFEEAIRRAREMTDVNETLIIVTADHGHALTLPGYLDSDETIFGSDFTFVPFPDADCPKDCVQ
uniref:alkaline phosphatase n=1 Tax=Angiostrongylus cantonensis TaxID=6313 RepID=A0A158PCA0_ANGCA